MIDRRPTADSFSPGLLRKSALVASGQAVGYALALAATPLLSRLYSPHDFGLMAIFVSLLNVLGTMATLRYDNAIALPQDEHSAAGLAALAHWTALVTTACLLLAAALWGQAADAALFGSQAAPFSWLLAAAVAAYASAQIQTAWLVRCGKFAALARTNLCYAVACLITQLVAPIVGLPGPTGLLVGQLIGYAAQSLHAALVERPDVAAGLLRDFREMRELAAAYRKYPLLDVWSALARVLAVNGQALMLAWAFGPAAAGGLALAQRLLATPISLLSFSLSRVYYCEAAVVVRERPQQLRRLSAEVLKRLTLLAAPPLAGVALVAPWVFGPLLGSEWRMAGVYCSLLCPLILLRVIAFVLGPALDVVNRQGLRLVQELTCFALIAAGMYVAKRLEWSELTAVAVTCALGCLGYLASIAMIWTALVQHSRDTAPWIAGQQAKAA